MSYVSQVQDDGSPIHSLDNAGQAARDLNHRATMPFRCDRDGWPCAPDAYCAIGEMTYLAGGLPQACQQIGAALQHALDAGLIGIDRGATWADNPSGAVQVALLEFQNCVPARDQPHGRGTP
jgi:hypothetical protein